MRIPFLVIILVTFTTSCQSTEFDTPGSTPPSHELWDQLLAEYVSVDGLVDYPGMMKKKSELQTYLDLLSKNPPDLETWSDDEQMAYWINAYNAFAIKLISDHYPVQSIQDLNPTIKIPGIRTVWHKKFFKIGGKRASLDQIEHKILRTQFEEPRIHFAINCASISCPPLRNEAFTPAKLHQQLDDQARQFINDTTRNEITYTSLKLSKIFRWFKGDFTKQGSLIDYLNRYSIQKIDENASISWMNYDWRLNGSEE